MDVQMIRKNIHQQKLESIFLADIQPYKNKHTLYRGKDCMKKFRNCLREHAQRIIAFEKKTMLLLTNKELKSHEDGKVCYICGKDLIKIL